VLILGGILADLPAIRAGNGRNWQYASNLVSIPAPNTQNDDHNPQRVAPRSLFDLAIGDDNLFKGDRYQWSLQVNVINLTDKYTLYTSCRRSVGHTT